MFDFITIGGATRDMIFLTEKGRIIETPENLTEQRLLAFEYGAKIKSEEVYVDFGGGACNAGATFAKMGFDVAVMCRVGDDESGKSLIGNLHNHNIDTSLVQTGEARNSAFSFMVVNSSGNDCDRVAFTHRGASDGLRVDQEAIKNAKWIYLTSFYHNWKNNLQKIYTVAQEDKIKIAWNPGAEEIKSGRKRLMDLMPYVDIFMVNKDEAIELAQKNKEVRLAKEQLNDTGELIKLLKSWGAKVVVITDGENGAFVCGGEEIWHALALAEQKIDTTGAGDAFGSAFVAGYELTGDLEEALKYGILNSGSVVGHFGAQKGIMTRGEIKSGLEKIEVLQIK